jgi:Stage II sporulation protein E (SpoIIE)
LLYRHATGSWELFDIAPGDAGTTVLLNAPLGIAESAGYRQTRLNLGTGDMILAYTDELTEARVAGERLLETTSLLKPLMDSLREQATEPDQQRFERTPDSHRRQPGDLVEHNPFPFRLLKQVRDKTRFREPRKSPGG